MKRKISPHILEALKNVTRGYFDQWYANNFEDTTYWNAKISIWVALYLLVNWISKQ